MSRSTLVAVLLALPLFALATPARSADPVRPEGTIDMGDDTRVEVLSKKIQVGERIDLPEGWYRVEEEGVEDREVGSFTIASMGSGESAPIPPAAAPPPALPPEAASSPAAFAAAALDQGRACRQERNAYLRELWRESGIEVDDPDALLRGLDAGASGPSTGYYWFALSTDAFRNLAWSSDLRSRARDLIRCVNQHQ